jgi:hypothetical protein
LPGKGLRTGRSLKWPRTIIRTIRTPILPTRRIRSTHRGLSRPAESCTHLGPTGLGEVAEVRDLPLNWWATAQVSPWWEWEVTTMGLAYPSFTCAVRRCHRDPTRIIAAVASGSEYGGWDEAHTPRERVEREQCGEFVLTWRGAITPFPDRMPLEETQAIVADLDEDRPVRVMTDGALAHYEHCGGKHLPRPELQLGRPLVGAFQIEIAYRRPPGCPIARSLWPRIDQHHRNGPPPHLLNDIDALCVLFPADGAWTWPLHGIREYANYTAIWLGKHLAWVEARERGVRIDEAWPGSVVGHDPSEISRLLSPKDSCRCGSGSRYGDCCAPRDRATTKEDSFWTGRHIL